jgi:hypothetical protein
MVLPVPWRAGAGLRDRRGKEAEVGGEAFADTPVATLKPLPFGTPSLSNESSPTFGGDACMPVGIKASIVYVPCGTNTEKNPPGPVSVAMVSVPSQSWQMNTFTPSSPLSPTSWMPLSLTSLNTVPHTPPDEQAVCADAGAAAIDASGSSAAASAATLMCFSGPSSSACVFDLSSV